MIYIFIAYGAVCVAFYFFVIMPWLKLPSLNMNQIISSIPMTNNPTSTTGLAVSFAVGAVLMRFISKPINQSVQEKSKLDNEAVLMTKLNSTLTASESNN